MQIIHIRENSLMFSQLKVGDLFRVKTEVVWLKTEARDIANCVRLDTGCFGAMHDAQFVIRLEGELRVKQV